MARRQAALPQETQAADRYIHMADAWRVWEFGQLLAMVQLRLRLPHHEFVADQEALGEPHAERGGMGHPELVIISQQYDEQTWAVCGSVLYTTTDVLGEAGVVAEGLELESGLWVVLLALVEDGGEFELSLHHGKPLSASAEFAAIQQMADFCAATANHFCSTRMLGLLLTGYRVLIRAEHAKDSTPVCCHDIGLSSWMPQAGMPELTQAPTYSGSSRRSAAYRDKALRCWGIEEGQHDVALVVAFRVGADVVEGTPLTGGCPHLCHFDDGLEVCDHAPVDLVLRNKASSAAIPAS